MAAAEKKVAHGSPVAGVDALASASASFSFASATKVLWGVGCLSKMSAALSEVDVTLKDSCVLLVTGHAKSGSADDRSTPIREALASGGVREVIDFHVAGEPTTDTADAGGILSREKGVTIVVSFGGGSVLDCGKAIAALSSNGGTSLDYLEVIGKGQPLRKRPLPFVAITTTAGTGAEVTKNAVLKSEKHQQKASLRSALMYPLLAVVDPLLTVSVPPRVTAATGLDAFTQCLEPFVSCLSNPLCDAIAIRGLGHGARSLQRAYEDGADIQARSEMTLCSLFGGLALANAKLGAVHGFAGVLGGMLSNAAHGEICAALLASTIEVNILAMKARDAANPALAKYDEAARVVVGRSDATGTDLVKWVRNTCAALKIQPLSSYGLQRSAWPAVVEKSAKSSSMTGNPIKLTDAELTDILARAEPSTNS